MKHVLIYQGPYEPNIARLRGANTYVTPTGEAREFRVPHGATGVRFGLLQKRGADDFVIARVQHATTDLILLKPIACQGTGPSGTILTREGALRYLEEIAKKNPNLKPDLEPLLSLVESSSAT